MDTSSSIGVDRNVNEWSVAERTGRKMKKYKIRQICKFKKIGLDTAKAWLDRQIAAGRWEKVKIKNEVFYVDRVSNADWHDIFNLRVRKPDGQAWAEYRETRDATAPRRPT